MRQTTRSLSYLAVAALAALALGGLPAQAAPTIVAYVDQPIVVGNQVFPGGEIEIVPVAGSGVVAVRTNGEQVATMFLQSLGVRNGGGNVSLVFHRDARGLLRLVGLERSGRGGGPAVEQKLRVAAVARGLASIDMPSHEIEQRLARR